jgi:ribose-phosphate pyrophosphokinase
MKIIGGTTSISLAEEIATLMKTSLVSTEIKRFSDNECYVRLQDSLKSEHVIIVQTTAPDTNISELLLLLDAVKREQAKKIMVVIPYYGYARQDKQFKEGEAVSAEAIARLISMNADTIFTVDPHKDHILEYFTVPACGISAVIPIAEYLQKKDIDLILAPDAGALERAKTAASFLGCDVDYLEKKRIDCSTIQINPKNLYVRNKRVSIIDDIIATGGTMAKSIHELKKQGAKEIYVACTHGLFAGTAVKKLQSAGCTEIIATDTISSSFSKVKTANIIVKAIQNQ